MNQDIKDAFTDVDRELSPQWFHVTQAVKSMAADLAADAIGSLLEARAQQLADETAKLCEHVDRVHHNVQNLLNQSGSDIRFADNKTTEKDDVVLEEILETQKEMHRESSVPQIIKALFMWKDDPTERASQRD